MTCSRESIADFLGARLFAMGAAVLRNGAFDFRAGRARPNRSRNRVRGGNIVDAGSHQRRRQNRKTGVRERFDAMQLRRELVRHGNPWWPREHIFERAPGLDRDGEVCLWEKEREIRGWLLKPFADARERFVGHLLRGHGCGGARREARCEQRQSHAIKTMMPRVQPDGGRR
jgi:hypothetical protein